MLHSRKCPTALETLDVVEILDTAAITPILDSAAQYFEGPGIARMAKETANSIGPAHPNPDLVTDSDYSPPRGNPFPIVGVGASAGGLEAFAQLLSNIPENTGLAFVLVQHLDPQHESLLAELLSRSTKMGIQVVHDGIEIRPNRVYVIPPNTSMELADGHLRLVQREPGLHLPIDIFFRSLAHIQGSRAIGIVL